VTRRTILKALEDPLKGKFVIAPHVFVRELDDQLVLLDLDGGEYFGIDAVGALVWRQLEASGSVEDALSAVRREFDVDEDRAREDVLAFVAELEERKIVTRSED
jgi:hypothetical protein